MSCGFILFYQYDVYMYFISEEMNVHFQKRAQVTTLLLSIDFFKKDQLTH